MANFKCYKCDAPVGEWEYRWDARQCKDCGDKFIKPRLKEHFVTVFVWIIFCVIIYLLFGFNQISGIFISFFGFGAFVWGIYNAVVAYGVYNENW